MAEEQSNIIQENNVARAGMNLDNSANQIPKGQISYGLNASIENFDQNGVSYQNEPGNELCLQFPEGFQLIGKHFIIEQNKHIFFLTNPIEGDSEIGYMQNNDCIYRKLIGGVCLNFNINYPILKSVHKITNCTTEIYWTDGYNSRRYLDLNNLPFITQEGVNSCDNIITDQLDCNKLKIQPNFSIPSLEATEVVNGGNLIAGTYQFAIQYTDSIGDGYTSFYSVTNPLPISNPKIISADFNYPVGKSIIVNIDNIDITGYFQYFNVVVIKTINNITSVELIGTYTITDSSIQITYTGQNQTSIKLTITDIFEKFPYYDIAQDVTAVQDVLVWDNLTSIDRINYQQIANKISLQWESWRIPNTEDYSDELNSANLRGYLRDEIYPFEIVFLLKNGKQTDGFHIPGRSKNFNEFSKPDVPASNPDFIGTPDPLTGALPYWKIYNTASVTATSPDYTAYSDYKGPYQYGEFAYWESTEKYPCNIDIWGDLADTPIRHHKFPDVRVSPIFENPTIEIDTNNKYTNLAIQKNAIFPIGVKLNVQDVNTFIQQSSLTQEQKDSIAGFKIVRGDRSTNKSIVAKGILRNVGKYEREGTSYYFPNYPYNDLREDPFLLEKSNAYFDECSTYILTVTSDGSYQYNNCYDNTSTVTAMTNGEVLTVCSTTLPVILSGSATINKRSYDTYTLTLIFISSALVSYIDYITETTTSLVVYRSSGTTTLQVKVGTVPTLPFASFGQYILTKTSTNSSTNSNTCYPSNLSAFNTDDSKYRHVFNSPETSFGQPFLGNILKLETAIFGAGSAHYVQVKKNALYRLISKEAQEQALKSSEAIADITSPFSSTAMFTAYQAYLQIYINGITRKNYGWSYNSIADYDYYSNIDNGLGIKQRELEISQYLIPGVQSVGDNLNINNFDRESSVYLKTISTTTFLPFPDKTNSLLNVSGDSYISDESRFVNSQKDCANPGNEFDISTVSYYASLKNNIVNQWGQIYSYETIDTGFQTTLSSTVSSVTIFGGDTFINRFSFKTKLPFFIDNRVGANDDSDIFYDEIGNVAYPAFWHSSRSILYDYTVTVSPNPILKNIISVKAHNLDCSNDPEDVQGITTTTTTSSTTTSPSGNPLSDSRMYYDGKMYMFAYGIPTFYVESSVNVDLRQAFNNREGDFYPRVSTGIPDDWVQESYVPIVQDNTYYYNVTYSKQNKENYFSHLPLNWEQQLCFTNFPFRAIYSDQQQSFSDNKINSWLLYRPASFFDFPQNYGKLTSLDGIENRQILARFENKSLLYNALYTNVVNTGGQVYLGKNLFSKDVPPLDYAETDLGYVGSQHKFLLKIPQGQITVDAKRGQVFLLSGNSVKELSGFGSGLNRFFTDHLTFEISRYFSSINIDNNFKGLGLHGVYDSKYDRIIITKLDYIPLTDEIKYDEETQEFYTERVFNDFSIRQNVYLTDSNYFCNKSWTISYSIPTQSWTSFHTYIPNWYIGENNFFYSGINANCDIDIIAALIIYCDLAGEAQLITTTTTTTTNDCRLVGTAILGTTTTTTTSPNDCDLEGTAILQ